MDQHQHSALANGEIEIIVMAFLEFPNGFHNGFRADIEFPIPGYGDDGDIDCVLISFVLFTQHYISIAACHAQGVSTVCIV